MSAACTRRSTMPAADSAGLGKPASTATSLYSTDRSRQPTLGRPPVDDLVIQVLGKLMPDGVRRGELRRDHRTLRWEEAGPGGPTVVFDASLGEPGSLSWAGVLPIVAARARVVAYDRAGLGASDPVSPLTLETQIGDLTAVLQQAGNGPCIVVGHRRPRARRLRRAGRGAVPEGHDGLAGPGVQRGSLVQMQVPRRPRQPGSGTTQAARATPAAVDEAVGAAAQAAAVGIGPVAVDGEYLGCPVQRVLRLSRRRKGVAGSGRMVAGFGRPPSPVSPASRRTRCPQDRPASPTRPVRQARARPA